MYGKIFESIFESTLVSEGGWLPTYIFMSMITIADKDGLVTSAPRNLYNKLGFRDYDSKITYDDFLMGIEYLEKEDPYSNSAAENGRRIVPLKEVDTIKDNRGWLIVNYLEYRKKASCAEPKGSSTERVRRFRERQKKRDETVCNGSETVCNGHTDTDTDINNMSSSPNSTVPVKKIVDYLNHKAGTKYRHTTDKTRRLLKARFNEGFTADDCYAVIDSKTAEWKTDPKMVKFLRPETLFGTKFESYLNIPEPKEEEKDWRA